MVYRQDNRPKRHRGRYTILGIVVGVMVTIGGFYLYDNYKTPIIENVSQAGKVITAQVEKDTPISHITQNQQQPTQTVKDNSVSTNIDVINLEHQVHDQINIQREQAGLKPLIYDEKIATIAREHSQDMGINNYFDHTSPDGKSLQTRFVEAKYPCYPIGENIQQTYSGDTPDSIVQSWMESSGHRENILAQFFSSEGIGIYQNGQSVFITEDFC